MDGHRDAPGQTARDVAPGVIRLYHAASRGNYCHRHGSRAEPGATVVIPSWLADNAAYTATTRHWTRTEAKDPP